LYRRFTVDRTNLSITHKFELHCGPGSGIILLTANLLHELLVHCNVCRNKLQIRYKFRCYKLMVMLAKTIYQSVSLVPPPANFDKCCSIQQLSVRAVLFDTLDVSLLRVW